MSGKSDSSLPISGIRKTGRDKCNGIYSELRLSENIDFAELIQVNNALSSGTVFNVALGTVGHD